MTPLQNHKYEDIIDLPHHQSAVHPQMPMQDRAAQFAPFAALTGHEAAIQETQRLTDREMQLDEDALEALDEKLELIREHIGAEEKVTFTCFVPDEKKEGGSYVTCSGWVKKLDLYARTILLSDNTVISLDKIVDIQGDLFAE